MRTVVQSDVRLMNTRMIFDLFRECRYLTRVEISQKLNMSLPSVSKIVDILQEQGICLNAGEIESPVGRKPLNLAFNPDVFSAIGVEFEGDRLGIGLANLDGTVKSKTIRKFHRAFDDRFAQLVIEEVQRIQIENPETTIVGIGIGVPGVVGSQGDCIEFAPLIGVENPLEVKTILEHIRQATGLEVLLENDTNAAAIGEACARGVGAGQDLVYISLGTGLGAGVVLDGELRRGAGNMCGEIGYLVEDCSWPTARSRTGYLESQLNTEALERIFGFTPDSDEISPDMLVYVAGRLSKIIANIVTLLDARLVVLGGVLTDKMGEKLVGMVLEKVNALAVSPVAVQHYIAEEPGVSGMALLMLESRINTLLA